VLDEQGKGRGEPGRRYEKMPPGRVVGDGNPGQVKYPADELIAYQHKGREQYLKIIDNVFKLLPVKHRQYGQV
jgi:hypothetical protein